MMNRNSREIISYVFFGGLCTLVSIGSFALFDTVMGINALISNVGSWILAVSFAYGTNRTWVFHSQVTGWRGIAAEAASFFGGRLLTLALEEAFLLVFITWLGFNDLLIKVIAQVFVMVSNYVISKVVVFRSAK